MKRQLFIAAIAWSMALVTHAAQTNEPQSCPSIASLKQTGIQHIKKVGGLWFAWSNSQFNTQHQWLFGLFVLDGNTESEAMESAAKTLNNLSVETDKPELDKERWGCFYTSGDSIGVTLTPPLPMDVASSLLNLRYQRSFLKKQIQ